MDKRTGSGIMFIVSRIAVHSFSPPVYCSIRALSMLIAVERVSVLRAR